MPQLHHLHGSSVSTSDFRAQLLPEDRQVFAVRRANMRRNFFLSTFFTTTWNKRDQVGKLARAQPRELAAVINPPECQAPVAIEAVPAQLGDVKSFARHGLHGIPEDRFYVSDFYKHVSI